MFSINAIGVYEGNHLLVYANSRQIRFEALNELFVQSVEIRTAIDFWAAFELRSSFVLFEVLGEAQCHDVHLS
jgi:recombinational DNA repair protein RecT